MFLGPSREAPLSTRSGKEEVEGGSARAEAAEDEGWAQAHIGSRGKCTACRYFIHFAAPVCHRSARFSIYWSLCGEWEKVARSKMTSELAEGSSAREAGEASVDGEGQRGPLTSFDITVK